MKLFFGFVNETRNGEMTGVQSWPKCWLSGSCPRAQCQRWWTMNICHSVVSCLMFKTKVSLKRRCFQQYLELENLIKYDAGWYIFFRSNADLNSSFTQANSTYRTTRGQTFNSLCLPLVTRRSGELTPLYTSTLLYNNLPSELRSPNISFSLFHCTIMKYLGHPVRRP